MKQPMYPGESRQQLKRRYNALLVREKNGEKYLHDETIPHDIRMQSGELYIAILKELNDLLAEIGAYSAENILDGFPEEQQLFETPLDTKRPM